MKYLFKVTSLSLILAIAFASCTKKRIEHGLSSGSGNWLIESYTVQETQNGETTTVTYNNAGSFLFNKNGRVKVTYTINGGTDSELVKWSNTKDKLSIGLNFDEVRVYDIKDYKKKSMTLVYSVSSPDGSGSITLQMKKQK